MSATTAPATRAPREPRNGVDTPNLLATINVVKGTPALAKFRFRASSRWINGTYSESRVESFSGAGGEHTHQSEFRYGADHPAVLVGQALSELGAAVLEDDRIALDRDDDVVRNIDRRPERHDGDACAIADVDDVRQDERADLARRHLALHLAEPVAPQACQVDDGFRRNVRAGPTRRLSRVSTVLPQRRNSTMTRCVPIMMAPHNRSNLERTPCETARHS